MGSKLHESKYQDGRHYGWSFGCPGCGSSHHVTDGWSFNGDVERPTFSPSILVFPAEHMRRDGTAHTTPRCHSFITDGRIAYCADSTHALAGQTVDLPDWDSVKDPYGP